MKSGLAIVTPVRDRIGHLKETLPTWCAANIVKQIVICDFGSDPGVASQLIDTADTKIKIVTCGRDEPWNKGLAQNIGIEAADYDIILKSDCDVFFKNLDQYVEAVDAGAFVTGYIPMASDKIDYSKQGCFGQIMLKKSDWDTVGGYHEFMHGWGFDDQDLYNRLEDAGFRHEFFNLEDLRDITHTDQLRGAARLVDDMILSLPEDIRRQKGFQNTRNKYIAGIVHWDKRFARVRTFKKVSALEVECILETRSKLETSAQLVAAYLAANDFMPTTEPLLEDLRRALVDERLGGYTARAEDMKRASMDV